MHCAKSVNQKIESKREMGNVDAAGAPILSDFNHFHNRQKRQSHLLLWRVIGCDVIDPVVVAGGHSHQ